MLKKYTLKIIYPISEDNFKIAQEIRSKKSEGSIFYEGKISLDSGGSETHTLPTRIPKSWLTEIKEPLSFEEFYSSCLIGKDPLTTSKLILEHYWNGALENQKPGVVVDDDADWEAFHKWIKGLTPSYSDIWRAALKYARETQ